MRRDLNPQPPAFQAGALPLSYIPTKYCLCRTPLAPLAPLLPAGCRGSLQIRRSDTGKVLKSVRLTFRRAKQLVGLDENFEICTDERYEQATKLVVEKIVEARRTGNDSLAADLSAAKALFKKLNAARTDRHCPICGGMKSRKSLHCQTCANTVRYYPNSLMQPVEEKEFVIEHVHLVTREHRPTAKLTITMAKLADEGQVGDSFIVCGKPVTTIKGVARMLGLEVMCRKLNPGEKDQKKIRVRVWRSDGLDEDAVNDIINKRIAGQTVPPPKKCVPPPKVAGVTGPAPA